MWAGESSRAELEPASSVYSDIDPAIDFNMPWLLQGFCFCGIRISWSGGMLFRAPGRNIIRTRSTGGREIAPDNQFVAIDGETTYVIIHPIPERLP
jgi:hypothetical protein